MSWCIILITVQPFSPEFLNSSARPLEKTRCVSGKCPVHFPVYGHCREVDWQQAAAEIPRHGGAYSLSRERQRSCATFAHAWVRTAPHKWPRRNYKRRRTCSPGKRWDKWTSCLALVIRRHVSLFSAVNSLRQQTWLLCLPAVCDENLLHWAITSHGALAQIIQVSGQKEVAPAFIGFVWGNRVYGDSAELANVS